MGFSSSKFRHKVMSRNNITINTAMSFTGNSTWPQKLSGWFNFNSPNHIFRHQPTIDESRKSATSFSWILTSFGHWTAIWPKHIKDNFVTEYLILWPTWVSYQVSNFTRSIREQITHCNLQQGPQILAPNFLLSLIQHLPCCASLHT